MSKILVIGGFSEIHRALKKNNCKLTLVCESSKIKQYKVSLIALNRWSGLSTSVNVTDNFIVKSRLL